MVAFVGGSSARGFYVRAVSKSSPAGSQHGHRLRAAVVSAIKTEYATLKASRYVIRNAAT